MSLPKINRMGGASSCSDQISVFITLNHLGSWARILSVALYNHYLKLSKNNNFILLKVPGRVAQKPVTLTQTKVYRNIFS